MNGASWFVRGCAGRVKPMRRAFRHGAVGSASDVQTQVIPGRGLIESGMLLQGPLQFAGLNQAQVVEADFRGRSLRSDRFWFGGVGFPKDGESYHRQKYQNDCRFLRHELPKAVPAILNFVNVAGVWAVGVFKCELSPERFIRRRNRKMMERNARACSVGTIDNSPAIHIHHREAGPDHDSCRKGG